MKLEKDFLNNNLKNDLENIVNNIEISDKNLKSKKKLSEKKPKPLPSINLMKTKTIRFIKEKRLKLLREIKKDKKNYQFVIESISKMRDETRAFKDLINKKPKDVKDLYFKFFWHLHWLKKND